MARPRKHDDTLTERIKSMRLLGMTFRAIARDLNVPRASVHRMAKR